MYACGIGGGRDFSQSDISLFLLLLLFLGFKAVLKKMYRILFYLV